MNLPPNYPEQEELAEYVSSQKKVISFLQENLHLFDDMDDDRRLFFLQHLGDKYAHRGVRFRHTQHPISLQHLLVPFVTFYAHDKRLEETVSQTMHVLAFDTQKNLREEEERTVTYAVFARENFELNNDLHYARMRGQKNTIRKIRQCRNEILAAFRAILQRIV